MRSLDAFDDLTEKFPSLLFCQIVSLNVLVKLSFICEFHDYKDICGGVKHFVEFNYIRMVDEFEDADLAFDLIWRGEYFGDHIFIFHFGFIDDFDCDTNSSQIVFGF